MRASGLSLELDIILRLVRLSVFANSKDKACEIWCSDVEKCDQHLLLKLALHHGLVAWLDIGSYFKTLYGADFDVTFSKEIESWVNIQRFNYERQSQKAADLSHHLRQNDVTHLFFKGAALMHQSYPNFIKSRLSDDLDMLVACESVGAALQTMQELNYFLTNAEVNSEKVTQFVESYPQWYRGRDLSLKTESGFTHYVDLHWKLADEFSFFSDTNTLLSNAVTITTHHGDLPSLPFHHHFVYLCAHGHADYFFRLRSLVDIFVMMNHLDFKLNEAMKIAEDHGVLKQLTRAISVSKWCFDHNNEDMLMDSYCKEVVARLKNYNGFTPRIHPNSGNWTSRDKRNHLFRQIKNRSSRAYWFKPLIARSKVTEKELNSWRPGQESIFGFYLKNLCRKVVR